jgi:hypothetical protein
MPRDDSSLRQRGETVRLPDATWALLDRMHASGWFTGPPGAGVIRHLVFDAVTKWVEGKDWRHKLEDTMTELKREEPDTSPTPPAEPPPPPKRVGRHQRMEEIYGEVCNLGEDLSGWQGPITEDDRAEIRKMANELLTLMDEHEKLDS